MYETPHLPNQETPLIIGETTFRKTHHRFGIRPKDRLRHLWVLGKTGAGKSTLLARLIAHDLAQGNGVAVLDPHGSLIAEVLPQVPSERTADVLLISADAEHPVSFNLFRQGKTPVANTALLTSNILSVFRKQWADSWGPRLEHIFRNALMAVAAHPEATLLMVYRFLTDKDVRPQILRHVHDPVVRHFWTVEFPGYSRSLQADALSPVLNKLGAFISMPLVRNMVGQVRSRVDLLQLMNRRGVLLADLSVGQWGDDASRLLGGFITTALQLATMRRGVGVQTPFYVYIDEFQNFVTDALATTLAEARKFGLGLTLAHQYVAQLPRPVLDAMLGNIGTVLSFRLGAQDALELAPEFEPEFTAHDLTRLPRFHLAVKLLIDGQAARPFSARSLPGIAIPADATERRRCILQHSRQRHGRRRDQVERAVGAQLPHGR